MGTTAASDSTTAASDSTTAAADSTTAASGTATTTGNSTDSTDSTDGDASGAFLASPLALACILCLISWPHATQHTNHQVMTCYCPPGSIAWWPARDPRIWENECHQQ